MGPILKNKEKNKYLYSCDYQITHNRNEDENKKKKIT